jgi:hypothetical protein
VTNPKKTKPNAFASRKAYYDWLAQNIMIDGIVAVERDFAFDNPDTYNSGGIRLKYEPKAEAVTALKDGILLEAGFDTVTPNTKLTISSWAYDRAITAGVEIIDNRALDIACYHPGYTFVEKLQTITTKFRQEQTLGRRYQNLMRQYYDVYCLLENKAVQDFIGTPEYHAHKEARFRGTDKETVIAENEAFLLRSFGVRDQFRQRYEETADLYYKGQPPFEDIIARIGKYIDKV